MCACPLIPIVVALLRFVCLHSRKNATQYCIELCCSTLHLTMQRAPSCIVSCCLVIRMQLGCGHGLPGIFACVKVRLERNQRCIVQQTVLYCVLLRCIQTATCVHAQDCSDERATLHTAHCTVLLHRALCTVSTVQYKYTVLSCALLNLSTLNHTTCTMQYCIVLCFCMSRARPASTSRTSTSLSS